MRKLWLLTAALFSLFFYCRGQRPAEEMRNFTQRDGLPSNESYAVFRDSKNYLWFATDEGVVRFNGTVMEHFDLPDNIIFKIREDEKGRIWFFSYSGNLSYYSNGKIYKYAYNSIITADRQGKMITDARVYKDELSISNNAIKNLFISASGKLSYEHWSSENPSSKTTFTVERYGNNAFTRKISDYSGYVHEKIFVKVLSAGKQKQYELPYGERAQPQAGAVFEGDTCYFFQGHYLYKLLPDGSFDFRKYSNDVLSLSIIDAGHLMAGVFKTGAYLIDRNFRNENDRLFLRDLSVSGSVKDHENGMWFSTLEKGIFYFPSSLIEIFSPEKFSQKIIYRVCNLDDSSFLFVTSEGLYRYRSDSVSLLRRMSVSTVYDLKVDQGRILMAAFIRPDIVMPALCFTKSFPLGDKEFKSLFYFQSSNRLFRISDNNYLGTQNTVVYLTDISKPSPVPDETGSAYYPAVKFMPALKGVMVPGTNDEVWLANNNAFLALNYLTGSVRDFKKNDSVFKKGITDEAKFASGISAVGTRFNGIALMKDTVVTAHIDKTNGLTANSIKCMLADGNRLWIATPKTISVITFSSFSPVKYRIHHIERNEEFLNIVIYQLCIHGKYVLVATSNGLYKIDRNISDENDQKRALPLYINSVSTYRGDTTAVESITLPFSKNSITVQFNAVCFDSPGDVKYYYRVNSSDTSWQSIGGTTITMDNLAPGSYKLSIKAEIPEQKRYSEIRTISITILKPWWQNNFVRASVLLLLLLFGFLFFRFRLKKEKNKAQQKVLMQKHLMELEHKALRSQMNPHFIFNCLTSIQHLIVEEKGKTANDYLVKFARLIRSTLEISKDPYISLENEMSYIRDYVDLEKMRFGHLFEFSISADADIRRREVFIPNMMIQPVVENCIRHGMKNMPPGAGQITINFSCTDDVIICTVRDNGPGFAPQKSNDDFKKHKSFGIEIISNRLQIFNAGADKKYFLEINNLQETQSGRGTEVILHLPLKKSSSDQGNSY